MPIKFKLFLRNYNITLLKYTISEFETVFSVGFEVDVGSWEVDGTEAKCQEHFAEAGNLREVNYVSQLDKLPSDETANGLF